MLVPISTGLAAGLAVALKFDRDEGLSWLVIWAVFASATMFFFPAMATGAISGQVTHRTEVTADTPLVSLANGSQVEGSFFLGSGSINSTPVYSYVTGSDVTGYQLSSVDVSVTKVFTSQDPPHLVAVDVNCSPRGFWPRVCSQATHYRAYIPAGSIWQGYNVDVRN
jgi:hypothetical protein